GGAEVTYWLQLKFLFDEWKKPLPVIFLRNSVLWIDTISASRLEKLQILPEELFHSSDEIINHYIEKQTGELISLEDEIARVTAAFDDAIKRTLIIDQSLKNVFESE